MTKYLALCLVTLMALSALSVAGLAATNTSTADSPTHPRWPLSMTAIDVGRGDALLLTYPNGKHMLVDAGESSAARKYVIPYLIQHKVTHLDAIVCTHEHSDHLDGLVEVLKDRRFTVDTAYDSGFRMIKDLKTANQHERNAVQAYLTLLKDNGVQRTIVRAGDTIKLGYDEQFHVSTLVESPTTVFTASLAKDVKDTEKANNHAAINEDSVVLMLKYNDVRFLLAGDTGLEGAKYADRLMLTNTLGYMDTLKADVLKLGHHGFDTPDDKFYSVVKPRYVVMTFGPLMTTDPPTHCEDFTKQTQNVKYFTVDHTSKLWSTYDKGDIVVSTRLGHDDVVFENTSSTVPKTLCDCPGQPKCKPPSQTAAS